MNKKLVALLILLSSALSMYSQISDTLSIQNLSEVVVKGQIPHIKENNGILIVNLPEIVKDKPVTNILEALGYMPCVTNKSGRIWYECDIDTMNQKSRGAKRIVFSNRGDVYYTGDHYETFTKLY